MLDNAARQRTFIANQKSKGLKRYSFWATPKEAEDIQPRIKKRLALLRPKILR